MSNFDSPRVHIKEKTFICELCDKGFSNKYSLKVHCRVHTKKKLFSCEVCQKEFSHKSHLNGHLRLHTKEKTFICELCNKGFSNKYNLKVHCRVHTKKKLFSCEVCQKEFSHKSHLNGHLRLHTNEKTFSSQECNKGSKILTSPLIAVREMVAVSEDSLICKIKALEEAKKSLYNSEIVLKMECDILHNAKRRRQKLTVSDASFHKYLAESLSGMEQAVSLSKEIHKREALNAAKEAVDDSKALLKINYEILQKFERNRQNFLRRYPHVEALADT